MSFESLAALSEDLLHREQKRRVLVAVLLLGGILTAAVWGIRSALQYDSGLYGYVVVLGTLVLGMLVVLVLLYWSTRPLYERSRRRRLVIRQAMGVFPSEEDVS